ncbi:Lrp/AsnC family transcriptional regulator [Rothia kristinae]|uniref:Lrp/AsnC family transcriptional regulator n=1 Tax=Rothia kristinae TaxID=37923 RepID=UPI000A78F84E|nr:Lrp/AsnC family transcriptional regulator [Rothia kristinae]
MPQDTRGGAGAPASLDRTDLRILRVLEEHPRATVVAIAERTRLARRTVQAHLERMQAGGALRSPSVRVEPESLGYRVSAHVAVELDQRQINDTVMGLTQIPEVVEVQAPAGETDLLVRVVARDEEHLYRVSEEIRLCPGVLRTRTSLYLRTLVKYRMAQLLD